MGNKEFKPVIVSYDEAVKRVSPSEIKRLKETFKQLCPSTYMTLNVFAKHVLGEGVPHIISEQIFYAFGANSGRNLTFKELLCGLVLFTRAHETNEEKIKFIFGLYADDSFHIHKEIIDDIILKTDGQIPESLSELFEHTDKVDYTSFKKWLLLYPEFSTLSYWLILEPCASTLTVNTELPSFYQTLAGVTHLSEAEIIYLETNYNKLRISSNTGRFDLELFRKLVSPPLPRQLTGSLYKAFDENLDGHIDFKEMVCGLSACCKGPEAERQKFCFKVFDLDQDGFLSKAELIGAIEASFTVLQQNDHSENQSLSSGSSTVADLLEMDAYTMAGEIIGTHSNVKDGYLSQAEYLVWAVQSKVPQGFSELLFEVCHVILGMKPASRDDEGKVVKGWLSRELKRGYSIGQTWYLVSSVWWRRWLDYVSDNVVLEAIELENSFDLVLSSNDSYERRYSERSCGDVKIHHPARPGSIDNSGLILHAHHKVPRWTNEGGVLKPRIQQGKDFELIPELLWLALHSWYRGEIQLPRPVIIPQSGEDKSPQVELYSLTVKLYKHQAPYQTPHQSPTTVGGMAGGIANVALSMTGLQNNLPKRVLVSTAAFSYQHSLKQILDFLSQRLKVCRDDLRLWKYHHDNDLELLEGEEKLLEDLGISNGQSILMEVRSVDLTWPEEMLQLLKRTSIKKKESHVESGTTGLSNLGNTCFMNSAIQCVSNCQPLTMYFRRQLHLYELNRNNPLGMKGRLAQLYGELIRNLWDGTNKNLPPVELRYTLAKYAPQFTGCQQQDAQELLAFLLDGLHEDLNRVQKKPYVELKDSDGRKDEIVAKEGWDHHLLRNQSIIVDLFHGQLKSVVRCQSCSHASVRFDPFTFLTLPLPMENALVLEVIVIRKDGAVPVRYGLRLNSDDKYADVRQPLSKLSTIPGDCLLFVELYGSFVKSFPLDSQKIKQRVGSGQPLVAYELDTPLPTESEEMASEPTDSNGNMANGGFVNSKVNGSIPTANGSINGKPPLPNGDINGRGNSSPGSTLSRGSRGSSQALGDQPPNVDNIRSEAASPDGVLVAMHRKMERREHYFMASQQSVPCIFGVPLVLQTSAITTHRELYHSLWTRIKRFVTGHPVTESCNHAQDCDGSLGNEYPFKLLMTRRCGGLCSRCPFYKFCRGCLIDYTDETFNYKCDYIAIDWDPTAYYLRYQASPDVNHSSVREVYASDDPIDIQQCLEAFTKEEKLDELYFCSKCKQHRTATKKLELWRLPKVLIIHLKRFWFLSNRWIKSQKSVDFPLTDFDPELYLAQRSLSSDVGSTPHSSDPSVSGDDNSHSADGLSSQRSKAPSVTSHDSLDYSQTKYDLFAVSCHRGNLGGGHYVACTKNPNGKWYEYNDSMVKELSESSVSLTNQRNCYILFYERQGLNYHEMLPNTNGRRRDDSGLDEEYNTELSKAASCVIQ